MRIWIARPEPGATRTAKRIAGLGHTPIVGSIFSLVPSGDVRPDGPFDGLLLTSANAANGGIGPVDADLPTYCVGQSTAQAAKAAGYRRVLDADGDALALARLVRDRLPPGSRLLHFAGAEHKPEPAASLAAAGYIVTVHTAYAMQPISAIPASVAEAFDARSLAGALHYSRRGAETALALAEAAGYGGAFRVLTHYCLSDDVAAPLVAAGCVNHVKADRPSEDSLLQLLPAADRDTVSLLRGSGC
ncbi:MAG: uroporphyrinogen-III synthase [Methylobacterium sp.]|uniref:uroporphyrinogen-III synthase n=1 Tax=Methylobacterium sp. TaxID=409 RepID=UPI0025E7030F|nr:uroporphyrinogen-III synthase [Methylobacterium sp.]MBX9929991.1 uroporphyrinogen-III synthase [Methylobacterium sp.]